MSHFLGAATGRFWSGSLPQPDERSWPSWFKILPTDWPEETRWPRSQLRSGNFLIDNYANAPLLWDWQAYVWTDAWGGQAPAISGVTRDVNGNVLANVTVFLYDATTDLLLDKRTSDSNGNFLVSTAGGFGGTWMGGNVYLRAEGSGVTGSSGDLTPA